MAVSHFALPHMEPHNQQRLEIEGLPVKVWGMDADRRPFVLNAVACEVSYRGARLDGLTCKLPLGEVIAVQYGSQKGRFRVVWMADPASGRAGQVGIRSVDDICIWEAELAYFSLETNSDKSDPLAAARRDRRQYPRFRCQGNVQVSRAESGQHVWAKLGDLSLGGCYLSTPVPEAVGAKLRLLLQIDNNKIAALGEVRTCVPALGMGVQFTEFESGSRELLKQVLERLSPPRLVGRPQVATPPELSGSAQALVAALRNHFEGHNVLTSPEFEAIVKALGEKKMPPGPAPAVPAKPA
ncbi:MAG TPA: PilZ domain-containing protein [Terriglobales bacterium]|nr:PilZ domain-containing protein [Terriglobales bacterium]